jgi:hypothetical protein
VDGAMSGLDEQINLRICPCCDEDQNTWNLIDIKGRDLGLFNQDEQTIIAFNVLNSGYYRSHGAEKFWEALKGVRCTNCNTKIFEQNFMNRIIIILKENGY